MTPRPPGLLRVTENTDVVMMICTAGHVDHGKTRLVKLLTGCSTDRLKVEQERGLTIELGFAPCVLGGDMCIGIVDVPGHEKFIKNMVAGVSGIGMTVLVIAADDGVMPQTIEHLQIMELLGVRRGLVALTKIDLVPQEMVQQRVEEISSFLKGTFLDGAPVCPLSLETGEGIFPFYETLVEMVKGLAHARAGGVFRMPVERSFIQKGFGVVLTGIPLAGTVELGMQVALTPGGQSGRVRNIQCFLRDAASGGSGQCLALNIPEIGKRPVLRGQVLCLPGYLNGATVFHVRTQAVPGIDPPLRHGESVKFHTGTSETPAKVYLLEDKILAGGQAGLATLVVSQSVAAAPGDRFLLRRPSPAATVAGGEILFAESGAQRPRKHDLLARLVRHPALTGTGPVSPEARMAYYLGLEAPSGASLEEIARAVLLLPAEADAILQRLAESGRIHALDGGWFIDADVYGARLARLEARLIDTRDRQGMLSLKSSEVLAGVGGPPSLGRRLLEDLEQRGLVALRGGKILLRHAGGGLSPADQLLADALLKIYADSGFASPRPEEVPELIGAAPQQVERLLGFLCDEGRLIRLNKNVVLCYNHFKTAQDKAVEIILAQGVLDSADFKVHIGSTRKYALAILDYLDARRVTVRFGNDRKLTTQYREHLL